MADQTEQTNNHEVRKDREVLTWKIGRRSQGFAVFLEDCQDS